MASRNLGNDYEFTVRAPKSLRPKLRRAARNRNVSQAAILREIIADGIERVLAAAKPDRQTESAAA